MVYFFCMDEAVHYVLIILSNIQDKIYKTDFVVIVVARSKFSYSIASQSAQAGKRDEGRICHDLNPR